MDLLRFRTNLEKYKLEHAGVDRSNDILKTKTIKKLAPSRLINPDGTWKEHKYLYKDADGRYVYAEPQSASKNPSQKRQSTINDMNKRIQGATQQVSNYEKNKQAAQNSEADRWRRVAESNKQEAERKQRLNATQSGREAAIAQQRTKQQAEQRENAVKNAPTDNSINAQQRAMEAAKKKQLIDNAPVDVSISTQEKAKRDAEQKERLKQAQAGREAAMAEGQKKTQRVNNYVAQKNAREAEIQKSQNRGKEEADDYRNKQLRTEVIEDRVRNANKKINKFNPESGNKLEVEDDLREYLEKKINEDAKLGDKIITKGAKTLETYLLEDEDNKDKLKDWLKELENTTIKKIQTNQDIKEKEAKEYFDNLNKQATEYAEKQKEKEALAQPELQKKYDANNAVQQFEKGDTLKIDSKIRKYLEDFIADEYKWNYDNLEDFLEPIFASTDDRKEVILKKLKEYEEDIRKKYGI